MPIQLTGLASGLDTASIVNDLMELERTRVDSVEKEIKMVEYEKEVWEEMNTELYSFYREELFDFKSNGTYLQKTITSSDTTVATMNSSLSAVNGVHSLSVTQLATGSHLTGDALTGVSLSSTGETLFGLDPSDPTSTTNLKITVDGSAALEVTITAEDTLDNIIDKIDDLDLDLSIGYDETYNRLFLSTTATGDGTQIDISSDDTSTLFKLGLAADGVTNVQGTAGTDAKFSYNNTDLESDSNEISVNGLSFNIQSVGSTTITVNQDTDAIYDKVKDFITAYNDLVDSIYEKVDSEYNSEYEPLTDDEKEAMTEDEIEAWEERIKGSILKNDDILSGLGTRMRSILTTSYGVDTSNFKYNSLADLGIVTSSDYLENGKLHIRGDEDDSDFSLDTNSLRAALEDNPDDVMELLTALGNEVYSYMAESMRSSTLSSSLTFYNDKYLDSHIEDYEDEISELEDRMQSTEDRYYAQFTAMEQAIQQSNSTGEWLAQQLAGM